MSLFPLGLLSQGGGAGGGAAAFELISTQVLSSAGIISFTSLPTTYKHLQLRMVTRSNTTTAPIILNLNSTTMDNGHRLLGNGSTVASSSAYLNVADDAISSDTSGIFAATIIDLLDYRATTKFTTVRSFSGKYGATTHVSLSSNLHAVTEAISTIDLYHTSFGQFAIGSRFSLYGIKG